MRILAFLPAYWYFTLKQSCVEASRFQLQGPIVTVTLRDPSEQIAPPYFSPTTTTKDTSADPTDEETAEIEKPRRKKRLWNRFRLNNPHQIPPIASTLSPTILAAIRSSNPLPNYFPALQSTSLTASYNYHDIKDKPNFVETDMRLYSKRLGLDVDIGGSYNVQQNAAAVSVRVGAMEDPLRDGTVRGGGSFGMVRFMLTRGKKYLQFAKAQYSLNLPFHGVGSIAISPSYNFDKMYSEAVTVVGYSGSGRTAAVLNLNWDAPTLSVKHALDARNTIQPEISLLDAKILYNWNVALTGGSSIRTRVDPTDSVQVSWIDETRNGKWVTDFRLPLISGAAGAAGEDGLGAALNSQIRVRRQFVF